MVSRNNIGKYGGVSVTDMRLIIHIINGRGNIKITHGLNPHVGGFTSIYIVWINVKLSRGNADEAFDLPENALQRPLKYV
jgi:hypothetical protein